ncbi:MAG: hypothetical protein J7M25_00995 [Deltaproteobacteria bacterium]|nr:hypothetical protein [Deltaproteobacteria bacterium]
MFSKHEKSASPLPLAVPNAALLALDSQRQTGLWSEALHRRGWAVLDTTGIDLNQTSQAGFRPDLIICNKKHQSEIYHSLFEPSSIVHGWATPVLPPDVLLVEGLDEGLAGDLPVSDVQSILGTNEETDAAPALVIPTATLMCTEEADRILERVIESRNARYRRLEEEARRPVYAESSALLVTAGRTAQFRQTLRTIHRAAAVAAAVVIERRDGRTLVEATTDLPRRQMARMRTILESMDWSDIQTERWQPTPASRQNLPEAWRHARILPISNGLFCILLNDRPFWSEQAERDIALVIEHLKLVIERPDEGWNRHQWLPPDRQPLTGFLSLEGLHIWLSRRHSPRKMDILSVEVINADQVEHHLGVIDTGRLARRIARALVQVAAEEDVLVQPSTLSFSLIRASSASRPSDGSVPNLDLVAKPLAEKMQAIRILASEAASMLPTDSPATRLEDGKPTDSQFPLEIHITSCSTNTAAMDVMWPAETGDPCAKARKKFLFKIQAKSIKNVS